MGLWGKGANAQVICVKCGQSKDDNIAPTCQCGGAYKTSMNRGDAKNKLKMIQSGECCPAKRLSQCAVGLMVVCDYHDLQMAGEYVASVLSRW